MVAWWQIQTAHRHTHTLIHYAGHCVNYSVYWVWEIKPIMYSLYTAVDRTISLKLKYLMLCVRLAVCRHSDSLSMAVYVRRLPDDRITPQHLQSLFGDIPGPSLLWLCVCLFIAQGHPCDRCTTCHMPGCMCGHVCACVSVWHVCVFVTSYRPSQLQTHILKVTNQARWPFGKIKDTFLKKKETPLIYCITPITMAISATEGRSTRVWSRGLAGHREIWDQNLESFYMLHPKIMVVKAKSAMWGGKVGGRMREAECKRDRDIKPPLVPPDRC